MKAVVSSVIASMKKAVVPERLTVDREGYREGVYPIVFFFLFCTALLLGGHAVWLSLVSGDFVPALTLAIVLALGRLLFTVF